MSTEQWDLSSCGLRRVCRLLSPKPLQTSHAMFVTLNVEGWCGRRRREVSPSSSSTRLRTNCNPARTGSSTAPTRDRDRSAAITRRSSTDAVRRRCRTGSLRICATRPRGGAAHVDEHSPLASRGGYRRRASIRSSIGLPVLGGRSSAPYRRRYRFIHSARTRRGVVGVIDATTAQRRLQQDGRHTWHSGGWPQGTSRTAKERM